MPSKGKRAASRQAQLSKRKRRAKPGGNQVFQAEPVRPAPTEGQDDSAGAEGAEAVVATSSASSPSKPASRPARRSRSAATEAAPPYEYLGSELLRIGIIGGLIFAVLVALTFILGG